MLLFVGVPLLLTLWRAFPGVPGGWLGVADPGRFANMAVTATFLLAAVGVIVALLCDRSFDKRELRRVLPETPDGSLFTELKRMLVIWVVAVVAISAFVLVAHPDWFLIVPRERPLLLLGIALFYPIFSVYPQGLVYRTFFLHRYRPVFGRWTPVLAVLAFAGMHAVFLNWVAPLLCLVGGALFTWTYVRTRSAVLAWLEHSVLGVTAFALGLGLYFYLGAPRDANGRIVPPGAADSAETAPAPTVPTAHRTP